MSQSTDRPAAGVESSTLRHGVLNLPDVIQGLQARRDAVFKTLNIG